MEVVALEVDGRHLGIGDPDAQKNGGSLRS